MSPQSGHHAILLTPLYLCVRGNPGAWFFARCRSTTTSCSYNRRVPTGPCGVVPRQPASEPIAGYAIVSHNVDKNCDTIRQPGWAFLVTGPEVELRDLALQLKRGSVMFFQKDGKWFMRSASLDNVSEAIRATLAARVLLDQVHGLQKLDHLESEGVRVDHCFQVQDDGNRVPIAAELRARSDGRGSGMIIMGYSPTIFEQRLDTTVANEELLEALTDFADALDFPRMRRIYETTAVAVIGRKKSKPEEYHRTLASLGWAELAQLERFWNTANSPQNGRGAHSKLRYRPERDAMSEREAAAFLQSLLQKWIDGIKLRATESNLAAQHSSTNTMRELS
jgi:hypothetical protein